MTSPAITPNSAFDVFGTTLAVTRSLLQSFIALDAAEDDDAFENLAEAARRLVDAKTVEDTTGRRFWHAALDSAVRYNGGSGETLNLGLPVFDDHASLATHVKLELTPRKNPEPSRRRNRKSSLSLVPSNPHRVLLPPHLRSSLKSTRNAAKTNQKTTLRGERPMQPPPGATFRDVALSRGPVFLRLRSYVTSALGTSLSTPAREKDPYEFAGAASPNAGTGRVIARSPAPSDATSVFAGSQGDNPSSSRWRELALHRVQAHRDNSIRQIPPELEEGYGIASFFRDVARKDLVRNTAAADSGVAMDLESRQNVIKNLYVDFGKILAHDPSFDDSARISHADGHLVLRQPAPRKELSDAIQWFHCYDVWQAYVLCFYPARRAELKTYRDWITSQLFDSPGRFLAFRNFDIAMRKHLGQPGYAWDFVAATRDTANIVLYLQDPPSSGSGTTSPARRRRPASDDISNEIFLAIITCVLALAPGAPVAAAEEGDEMRIGTVEELELVLEQSRLGNEVVDEEHRLRGTSGVPRLRRALNFPRGPSFPTTPAVSSTLSQVPLSGPPQVVLDDPVLNAVLSSRPDLFRVSTPFNIPRLATLLSSHPNRPLVESVLAGLRFGFWPGHHGLFDHSFDPSMLPRLSDEDADFLADLTLKDYEHGRTSAFFDDLLPGMLVSPEHAVRIAGRKPRQICDQSASCLNDGVPRDLARTTYDTLRELGVVIRYRCRKGDPPGVGIKSDVSQAFRNLPVSPYWQIKQVHRVRLVDRQGRRRTTYCVDHRLMLGGRLSPLIWCTILNLVLWGVQHHLGFDFPLAFVDDVFGYDTSGIEIVVRHPESGEERLVPRDQGRLLTIWSFVGCPWVWGKQESSRTMLTLLGHVVRFDTFTVTLPAKAKLDYACAIDTFLAAAPKKQPRLVEWQRIAGYGQRVCTTLPFATFALRPLYDKIGGKVQRLARVHLNVAVRRALLWLRNEVLAAAPLYLFYPALEDWTTGEADAVFYADACTVGAEGVAGIGFWAKTSRGRQAWYYRAASA
ncbi:hypothetical protein JCM21900_005183 [Sporobolomyces salmonicolor]